MRTSARRPSHAPAAIVTLLLLLAALLPAGAQAASGPTQLSDPAASPTSGVPTTTITLSVTYQNREGSAPDYVRVRVAGAMHAMRATKASESWKRGVRYTVSLKLPIGTHTPRFEASDRQKFTDAITGPTIVIRSSSTATPAPGATQKPTPASSSAPAPVGTPGPVLPGTSRDPLAPDGTTAPPTPAPTMPLYEPEPEPASTPASVVPAFPVPAGSGGGGGQGPHAGAGDPSPGTGTPGEPAPFGASPRSLEHVVATVILAMPVASATTGAVTLTMAFLVFGKRRRSGEPTAPDELLADAAATGAGVVADGSLPSARSPVPATAVATGVVPPDGEAHLPRWRRPSLLEARKADPLRSATPAVRLTFDDAAAVTAPDAERRRIRYRLVRLLDLPDEVQGREIGVLDEGDEVVLLEKQGTYWRVLCPDGSEGWLHKMTLGDTVIGSSASDADTWTSADESLSRFEDVLRAYRLRRGELPGA